MGYDTNELLKLSLAAIAREGLTEVEDVAVFAGCSKGTFYNHRLHEFDDIKNALHTQRVKRRLQIRQKFRDSDNPACLIAEFKLLATEDQLMRLNTQRVKTDLTISKPGISVSFGAEADDTSKGD